MAQTTSYCQLIPFSELAPGQAAAIRNETINNMIAQAVSQLGIGGDRLVVRDVRALEDMGFATEEWGLNTGSSSGYETYITGTNAAERWIAFWGVKASNEGFSCSALKFNVGGGDRAIWQLQALRSDVDDYTGLSPSAIIIPPNAPFTISRYVKVTKASCSLVLKGVVVEPRGKVISP